MNQPPQPTRLAPWIALSLTFYCIGVAATLWSGVVMIIPASLMWFLDTHWLTTRLFESLFYLHAQPPLLNLGLGLALKLEAATGLSVYWILSAFNLTVGAVCAVAYGILCARMLGARMRTVMALLLFLAHPMFYHTIFDYRYTIHEVFFLAWMAVFAWMWLNDCRLRNLVAAGLMACGIVYLRSLFHFAWAIGLILMLAIMVRPIPVRRWAVVAGLAAILIAWPLKNYMIFGLFTYSSWQGYNISQSMEKQALDAKIPDVNGLYAEEVWGGHRARWTSRHVELAIRPETGTLALTYFIRHPDVTLQKPVTVDVIVGGQLIAHAVHDKPGPVKMPIRMQGARDGLRLELKIDRAWTLPDGRPVGIGLYPLEWQTASGARPVTYDPLMPIVHDVPERLRRIPVLCVPEKPGGNQNWNHYWVIDYCRRRAELAMQFFRANPREIVDRYEKNYLYLTRFSSRHPYGGYVRPELRGFCNWMRFYETVFMQDFRREGRLIVGLMDFSIPTGFMFVLPLMLIGAAWRIQREWQRDPLRARLGLVMYYCVMWVMAIVLFIDGAEGNRIRFSTLPFLLILAAWSLPNLKPDPREG
ncbi:hypothetical protein LLG95_08975 [bacterium]|nr:hypothetical protein [bacterium]